MPPERPPARVIPGDVPASQKPNYERPEYRDGIWPRRLSRAMLAGTRGVRALGTKGLPKWPAEKPEFYKLRASINQVTRYYARAVQAVVGMVVGTPPTLAENTDPVLLADWEDIDGRGTHGEVFARQYTREVLAGGYAAILVDSPPVPETLSLTLETEQALGIRPYWVLVTAEQIKSWVVSAPDWMAVMTAYQSGALTAEQAKRLARQVVTHQVVIHEPTDVRDATFGVRRVDRYRQLTLTPDGVRFQVWEHRLPTDGTAEHFTLIAEGPMLGGQRRALQEIPLAVGYPDEPPAPFVSEPMLLSVAELNLDHHQVSAERRYLMRLTHAPTLFLAGVDAARDPEHNEVPIEVGPNSVVRSSNPDAKMAWVSAAADALDSSKEEREEIVRQIATLGMSFLARDQRATQETARGRDLDMAAENQTHAGLARGVQDALEQALKFHAIGRNVAPPEVEMHAAYVSPTVDPQIAALLWQAVLKGVIDVETWVAFLRTGKIPDGFDPADFDASAAASAEADAEAEAQRQADLGAGGDGEEATA